MQSLKTKTHMSLKRHLTNVRYIAVFFLSLFISFSVPQKKRRNETARMSIVNQSVFIFIRSHEPAQHSLCSPSDRPPSPVLAAPFKSQAHCETKPKPN